MFSPFWNISSSSTTALQELQQELIRLRGRCDVAFNLLLDADPRRVAQTPADVVYAEGRLRLLRYRPIVSQPWPVPLVVIPSLISRYYVLDLLPGRSMVEFLVAQGIDVYLLDWGVPRQEDRSTTFDQYITGYLRRAVQRVRVASGQDQVSLLGYSMGGTLTAIFSALYGHYVRNLVQLAAPIDFHDGGLLSQWTRKDRFNVDVVVDTLGAMPLALMQASFRMLKPLKQIMQQVTLAEQFDDVEMMQDLLAMQLWIDDNIPFLGEAYRKYIKDCYQENYLVQGKLVVSGRRVDLSRIDAALLNITATNDLLCPPQAAAVLNDLVASDDKRLLELPSGHVSVVTGRNSANRLWPQLAAWLRERSDR